LHGDRGFGKPLTLAKSLAMGDATVGTMATNDDLLGLAFGFSRGASVLAKRQQFREQLAEAMRERWLGKLVDCQLGRKPDGPFWLLTLNHPTKGVDAVVVRLGDLEPYSREALEFVLDRVARWAFHAP
jgi:hypothetical protein